jgi:hypothetical protein
VVKSTHNLWHTRTRHQQYFGDAKSCCMCSCETEEWRHVLTCGSINASLHRATSWGKLRKSMERWHLLQDFRTTIEKGVNHYTEQPHKRTIHSKDNEPQKPFGVTFNTPRHTNAQYTRKITNHKNNSELHLIHQGTYFSRHSGHNHTLAGTILLRVESAGIG